MCRRRGRRHCGMASGTAREDEKEAGRGRRPQGGTAGCQNRGGDGRVKQGARTMSDTCTLRLVGSKGCKEWKAAAHVELGRVKMTLTTTEEHYQGTVYNLPKDESLLAYVQKYGQDEGADTWRLDMNTMRLEDVLPFVAQKVTEMYVSQWRLL
ncbi:hypothetical protein NPIL_30901 [Nephila pilipes]|uniref:Uncharacterized protein n=1 Tax=Nephila pilipes TaxID=299642 RepID=A0A8X6JRB4_NEPPI|nr:hypothetical protein NPIL_30901 [Nephila pilipes]